MGRLLAREFSSKGFQVTLCEGTLASSIIPLHKSVVIKQFFFYDELAALLEQELKAGPDIVIHAAAVSDFKLERPFNVKISSQKKLRLELVCTEKLIPRIKKIVPGAFLVGFKFETRLTRAFIIDKTKGLFQEAVCDVVVANAQKAGKYAAHLVWPDGSMSPRTSSKEALVRFLYKEIQKII